MSTTRLEIVTPTRRLEMGDVTYLRAPGLDGLFGVMPKHAKSVIALNIGVIDIVHAGKREIFATSGGFAEIYPDHIMLLVESVERSEEINAKRAEAAAERARKRLSEKENNEVNLDRAAIALQKALNRLTVAGKKL